MTVELLGGAIRTYAWGSRTAIAEFTGRDAPTAHPEANCGSAPTPPTRPTSKRPRGNVRCWTSSPPTPGANSAPRSGTLRRCAAVPGQGARRRRTPVAAGTSERRRPSRDSDREERAGIPLSSPERNYRDRSHKPEILVALGVRGAGRIPARRTHRRTDARPRGGRPRPVHRAAHGQSTPTACARCSPPGSPSRSPTSTSWCPPCWRAPSTICVPAQPNSRRRPRPSWNWGAVPGRRRGAGRHVAQPDAPGCR
jgi:mannose-6-phosphate isomerase